MNQTTIKTTSTVFMPDEIPTMDGMTFTVEPRVSLFVSVVQRLNCIDNWKDCTSHKILLPVPLRIVLLGM